MAILLSETTWQRIKRLLDSRDMTGPAANNHPRSSRYVIVRCDSATPVGASVGNYLDQLYPATIIFASSDVTYPPLGDENASVIGDPVLLTVLGTDGADCPVAVEPVADMLYCGQLCAECELDPDVTGYVRARRRVVAIDVHGEAATGDVTGPSSAVANSLAIFNGTSGKIINDYSYATVDGTNNLILKAAGASTPYFEVQDGAFFMRHATSYLMGGNTVNGGTQLIPNPDGFDAYLKIVGSAGGTFQPARLRMYDALGADRDGITDTLADGSEVVGGVVVSKGAGGGGAGTVTSVSGGTTGLTFTNPTTTPTLSGTLDLDNGGTGASLTDPGADRFLGWDDSAGASIWFAPDASLAFSGTSVGVAELDMGTW